MKNIFAITLCLFCLNGFSQSTVFVNGLSLQFIQIESYYKPGFGLKPILDLGIGYERVIFGKVGMFASISVKNGAYDEKSERWNTEGTLQETNMKLGVFRRFDLGKRFGTMLKLNAFRENSKIDNYKLTYEGGSEINAKFLNRKYFGFEIGLQQELKLTERFRLFFVSSYQIGLINPDSDAWALEDYFDENFNLFESIGINYRW